MSLFTPLFLLGLLGIALPLWLHRLQTQTTERELFSSTMFMNASKKRIHVQRKLKYLLLMALRILFFILLALAFTRPTFLLPPQAVISSDAVHHVIVLDTSFSMKADDNFAQAQDIARDIVASLSADDQASIFTASNAVTTISPPNSDQSSLNAALSGLSTDSGQLDIGSMITAINGLIEPSSANFTLHIISDFQRSGQAVRFADMIPKVINGRPVRLALERVATEDRANQTVSFIIIDQDKASVGTQGYIDSTTTLNNRTLSISVNDQVQQQIQINPATTPAASATYLFEGLSFAPGDNRVTVQISPPDALPDDDLRYAVFDNSPPAPVLLLSANPDSLAVTYISAALETAPRGYEVEVSSLNGLDTRIFQRYPWLIIDDLGSVNPAQAEALTTYINGGGSVLAALSEPSRRLSEIPVSGHLLSSDTTITSRESQSVTQVDTSHSALDQVIGWNSVNVSQTLPLILNSEDRVLISLNDGTPLLLERTFGAGQLMLINTNLDNTWSDLPVKPVFATFLAEAAQYLADENVLIKEQVVDSFLQLTQNGGASGQIFAPNGEALLSLAGTTQSQDIQLNQTGYYRVITPQGEALIAVNPDSKESDLKVTEVQALQNWQTRVASSAGTDDISGEVGVSAEPEQEELEIWRVLLVLLTIIVLAESLLSNRYLRDDPAV